MAESKSRIYLWDNVKALLIIFVVMGHFVTQYTHSSEFMRSIFVIIYYFHMPLFVFVSGLFAKTSFKDGELKTNKIIAYLVLYLALKLIIFLEGVAVGKNPTFRLFYESGIPWYMLAMAVFICITYVLRNVKPQVLILCAVLLALISGYDNGVGDIFAVSRIIVFYPLFLLGYYTDGIKLAEYSRKPILRIASAILIVAFIVLAFVERDALYSMRPLVTGRSPFTSLPVPEFGAVYRLGYYIVSAIISFAVICVLPSKSNKLSYLGNSTLPIYFLHRPLLYLFMDLGCGKWLMQTFGDTGIYMFLALSVSLTFILSIKQLAVPFNKLMKCRFDSLFKQKANADKAVFSEKDSSQKKKTTSALK